MPFEKRLIELEKSLSHVENEADRDRLNKELAAERERVFSELSAWDRVQLARHSLRPRMLDYTARLFLDFFELHGDRSFGDDPAVVCGLAQFKGRTVFVVGQQKGVKTEEKVKRNFGMAHPEGYRKAMRAVRMAERLGYPIITFVDTPAAHPGLEAEERGQGPVIAETLRTFMSLKVPVLSLVLSEGGSGGALAIAAADRVAMAENAIYLICPPERCAEILWRDAERKAEAANALRVTATDLLEFGVIDNILGEGALGAHRDPQPVIDAARAEIERFLEDAETGIFTPEHRRAKFRRMGQWAEAAPVAAQAPATAEPAPTEPVDNAGG
ncbi:MAG: acetyl-CoA carboxylase carboxyltransferase subunit alpha [Candidatus Hydrogenedens sp.]|nr:acetyl-CoA carboxylase carboxyltransferase subunit alpha [Candidatus Hydrogenedens sp.]